MSLRCVNKKTAALIFSPINRRYITGFPSSLGYLLLTEDENYLFVDGRYFEAASKKVCGARVILAKNIYEQLNSLLLEKGIERLLIETENEIAFLNSLSPSTVSRSPASAIYMHSLSMDFKPSPSPSSDIYSRYASISA